MGDPVALPEPVEHIGDFRLQRDRGLGQVVAALPEVFGQRTKVPPTVADRSATVGGTLVLWPKTSGNAATT